MREERDLVSAFGRVADGYNRDAVIGAAANVLMNALRQSHARVESCEDELDELAMRIKAALRRDHYLHDGNRNDRRLTLPPAGKLFPSLDGRGAELLDRFMRPRKQGPA
jgi:hypothetical protein